MPTVNVMRNNKVIKDTPVYPKALPRVWIRELNGILRNSTEWEQEKETRRIWGSYMDKFYHYRLNQSQIKTDVPFDPTTIGPQIPRYLKDIPISERYSQNEELKNRIIPKNSSQ